MSNLGKLIKQFVRLPFKLASVAQALGNAQLSGRDAPQRIIKDQPQFVSRPAKENEHPVQVSAEGVGALFHRHYSIDIAEPTTQALALMQQIQTNPNLFSPSILATFEKMRGSNEKLAVGDDFHIHISGPWDGPVRVIDVQPLEFTFVTLEGHLEAGEITFRFDEETLSDDFYRFEISSWARSRDRIVNFAYDTLGAAKAAQTGMWVVFCQRVAKASGGVALGSVDVHTEKVNFAEGDISK